MIAKLKVTTAVCLTFSREELSLLTWLGEVPAAPFGYGLNVLASFAKIKAETGDFTLAVHKVTLTVEELDWLRKTCKWVGESGECNPDTSVRLLELMLTLDALYGLMPGTES